MSLTGALAAASSGLDSIGRQLAAVSHNIANASTPGYVRETVPLTDVTAGGVGIGVRTGPATRSLDQPLQSQLFASSAAVTAQQAQTDALTGLDAVSGTPGSGYDLPSLLGKLRDGFSSLANDPANQTQQQQVVSQAAAVASGVNALGNAVTSARQAAQDSAVSAVADANAALHNVGVLSNQIIAAQSRGESTASLEDARDAQVQVVSDLTGARFLRQANGDMLAVAGGLLLPLRAASGPLVLAAATLAADTPVSAVPLVTVGGANAGSSLSGQIGANLALRDTVLPAVQTKLDGFAQNLASSFQSQDLTLFTDGSGTVPSASPGFAQTIQVSSAVRATPSTLRDGSAPAGAAGNTTLINAVLDKVLNTGGTSLASQASGLTSGLSQAASDAQARLDTGKAVQSSLKSKLDAGSGVTVDTELAAMVQLQNAYGANARVMAAAQTMWNQLLDSVR